MILENQWIRPFSSISKNDILLVGGKNSSLGEMVQALSPQGVEVPGGFAITTDAYQAYLQANHLQAPVKELLASSLPLPEKGAKIRQLFLNGSFPPELEKAIKNGYLSMGKNIDVAIRSSATAEDLPEASFAGQQESYLHIRGIEAVLESCKKCFASLFTDRAITYREIHRIHPDKVALSIGIQQMVRADRGSAGVMFTLDPETGFPNVIVINGSWGLGETVVQGIVIPDEFTLFKPTLTLIKKQCGTKEKQLVYSGPKTILRKTPPAKRKQFVLTEKEVLLLSQWALAIENHYGKPMDIEWAKDGITGKIYIVQARPETVHSQKKNSHLTTYTLKEKKKPLLQGIGIGEMVVAGKVQCISSTAQISTFIPGSILVTPLTSPDWVPIMKQASGIITDHGGRTSHAAIVSRELGIPAIVGTIHATKKLHTGEQITLSCSEGAIYEGVLPFDVHQIELAHLPNPPLPLLMNISSPGEALKWWAVPCQGIGLTRMEFIIGNIIQIHPMALAHPEKISSAKVRKEIQKKTALFSSPKNYFIDTLAYSIAQIAAVRYPHPVIVRFTDFKTNEYARLLGGADFEPHEENPMLGFRGASRYIHENYQDGFALECAALAKAREEMKMTNIIPMIPFCRTLQEADAVLHTCALHGLERGKNHLQIYMMAEIPSNILLAEEFAERFDGFSIGSNDLTQLTLGIDRDSEQLAPLFDEKNPAVQQLITTLIQKAHAKGRPVGICGEAPSNDHQFASHLVQAKIDSISLSPDQVIPLLLYLSKHSHKIK